jgi:hypothetical protein
MEPMIGLAGLGLVLAFWLVVAYRRAAGSTLRAPVAWGGVALVAVMLVEFWLCVAPTSSTQVTTWRYLAAVGTFCPAMALLGAKRPQDRGWQFVVASLWLVLAVPALQSLVFAPQSRLDLHPAWQAFLLLLAGVSLVNYLPTRFALPACLVAAAQLLLLHDFGPVPWRGSGSDAVLTALSLLAMATTFAGIGWPRRQTATTQSDRAWLDFRDAFGAVWALRAMERINQAARQAGRAESLRWYGFAEPWDPLEESGGANDSLATTIRMLLRRFVSADWL